jgi:hypothetical protein
MTIRRAKREIEKLVRPKLPTVRVLSRPGASLNNSLRLYFLIVTDTEAEADALLTDYPALYSELCKAMIRAGYPQEQVPSLRFPIMSQQIIDRDFGGSWIEAISGP